MSLELVEKCPDEMVLPDEIQNLIDGVWEHIQLFMAEHRNDPVKGFQPSDFADAYRWLSLVKNLISVDRAPRLCEWGSGFGVVSVLAEYLGFAATAIESNTALFSAGQKWQQSVGSRTLTLNGSFIPKDKIDNLKDEFQKGWLSFGNDENQSMWLDLDSESVFDHATFSADSFDVIYAYPWPGEEQFLFWLFELVANPDTHLLSFHGAADFRLHVKTGKN